MTTATTTARTIHRSRRRAASALLRSGIRGYHIAAQMAEIPRAQDQLFSTGQSAREKYSALVVGLPGWGALLKYELVQLLSQHVPGALGLALRQAFFPILLGACGRNVVFGQNVVLRHPHKIRIGDNVVVDDNCLIDAKGDANAGIMIGSGVFVGRNTILSCKNGDIIVGDGANIGFNCEVFSASRVSIGRDTLLAAYCVPDRRRSRSGRRRAAGCVAGSPVSRNYGRRRMLDRRRSQGPGRRRDR